MKESKIKVKVKGKGEGKGAGRGEGKRRGGTRKIKSLGTWWLIILLLILGILPIVTHNVNLRETVFIILMYVTLAEGLNIILGYTGYVSFGQIVFYGIGGYVAIVLIQNYGTNIFIAMLAAGAFAALVAYLLGLAILRLRGAYFAIATIGILEGVKALVMNLNQLGSAEGIYFNMKVYTPYGGAEHAIWLAYWLMLGVTIASVVANKLIKSSKFGLGLMAIREDEDAAEVLGVNTSKYKTLAFALSALFPGMAGALFFFKNGNIDPESAFYLTKSIEMIFMVMLGGYGTVVGPAIGAIIYERITGILLMSDVFRSLHIAVSGIVLLLIVLFVPNGIIGYIKEKSQKLRRYLE